MNDFQFSPDSLEIFILYFTEVIYQLVLMYHSSHELMEENLQDTTSTYYFLLQIKEKNLPLFTFIIFELSLSFSFVKMMKNRIDK